MECICKDVILPTLFSLNRRKRITILIDFTTLRDDFLILIASVSYKGKGIPIYLKIWRYLNELYDFWGRIENFLWELRDILPLTSSYRFTYEIIADREFQGDRLINICRAFGWDYIIKKMKKIKDKKK